MRKILTVVGTRPNFMKVTRFRHEAALAGGLEMRIVHTGQHFDPSMSAVFFRQFGLEPDFHLDVPPGTPNSQIAGIMTRLEQLIHEKFRPDLMVVVGDVNSTLAAALTANKMHIPLAHVESGLRSFDRSMPEEFNRILTDDLADLFFITEESGRQNLLREGKDESRMHFCGNTMIDTLVSYADEIHASDILEKQNLQPGEYVLMTIHRPSTVDTPEGMQRLAELIRLTGSKSKVVFPVHPRTRQNLIRFGLLNDLVLHSGLTLLEPLDYFAFQKLVKHCRFVLTDSGGIQEETTFLGIPCLTFRPSTERPVTCDTGSNTLVPFELEKISGLIDAIHAGQYKKGSRPPMWDGKSTARIMQVLRDYRHS